jgi:hypothetical protein
MVSLISRVQLFKIEVLLSLDAIFLNYSLIPFTPADIKPWNNC